MKDFHIIGIALLIASGLIFTYMELKKNQNLLENILLNMSSKSIEKTYNQSNKIQNKEEMRQNNQVNIPEQPHHTSNINNIRSEIEKYQNELDEIDELLDDSESYETESDLDMEEMVEKVNSNIENTEFKHNDIIQHLEGGHISMDVHSSGEVSEVEDAPISMDLHSSGEVSEVEDAPISMDLHSSGEVYEVEGIQSNISNNSISNHSYILENKVDQSKQILVDTYYNKYTSRELKKLCNDNNLSSIGNKTLLINRLISNNVFSDVQINNINVGIN